VRGIVTAVVISTMPLVVLSAFSQTNEQIKWCESKGDISPDLRINGCTAVIQSGRWSDTGLAEPFNNRCAAFLAVGEYDKAVADCDQAIKLSPKYALSYLNRGNAFFAKQDYNHAIADYDQAIRIEPGYAFAFRNRGLAYSQKGDYDHAIADYKEAVRLDPKYAEAFNDRGVAYKGKGDLDHALADFEESIRLNPQFTAALKNRSQAIKEKNDRTQRQSDAKAPMALDSAITNMPRDGATGDIYRDLQIFGDVFEHVRADYVTKPDDWKLMEGAVVGMSKVTAVPLSALDEKQICAKESFLRDAYSALNCFGNVFEKIRNLVGNKISDTDLIYAAINGMVNGLDAQSTYFDAKSFRDNQLQARGELGAVGVEIILIDGLAKVVASLDDTPAAKVGIMSNDIISHIDDEPIQGLTLNRMVDKMKGPVSSRVKLTIMRKGFEKPIEITMVREVIRVNPVRWHPEGDDVGYIRISHFNEQTTDALKQALADLELRLSSARIRGFVIDLRNNPGGLIDQVISVSDAFLESGEILSARARNATETQRFSAHPGDLTNGKPLIVLINGGTAAGSEIMAGSLQDHRRATIIGTRSSGQGSIQSIIPLGAGEGALRLTTARFYIPSGRSIEAKGIVPDIEILQDVPPDATKSQSNSRVEHLNLQGAEQQGSQSYVPPNEKEDKALRLAIDLLRGVRKQPFRLIGRNKIGEFYLFFD
jgi:carboxyl-terminal processing protease